MERATAEYERARVTWSDLRRLREFWSLELDNDSLRRNSGILRRLLIERDLTTAWRTLSFEETPMIMALSLDSVLRGIPRRAVAFAQLGGGSYSETTFAGIIKTDPRYDSVKIQQAIFSNGPPELKLVSLRKFTSADCVVVEGRGISRSRLLGYISNKLGGVHFDPKRREKHNDYKLLDKAHSEVVINGTPTIYYELLSLGEALLNSGDIARFLTRGARLFESAND